MNNIFRILLVETDQDEATLLSMRLEAAGYKVSTAKKGGEALTLLAEKDFNLMIAAENLDDMDAFSLYEQVSLQETSLPTLIISSDSSAQQSIVAKEYGIYGILNKPINNVQLFDLINGALKSTSSRQNSQWREDIITQNPAMLQMLDQAKRIADSDVCALITGPIGSGKKLLAKAMHRASKRNRQPFIIARCGALHSQLLETELFGYVSDSTTEPKPDQMGLVAAAEGGTLLLDDIGELPALLQQKLLRLVKNKAYRPVGSQEDKTANLRIISTTSRDIEQAILSDGFSADLFYQLNVVGLSLPPLCDRAEDIPLLSRHFMQQAAQQYNRKVRNISPGALHLLAQAAWPDNIRQLQNTINKVVSLSLSPVISEQLVAQSIDNQEMIIPSFDEARMDFEKRYLTKLLRVTEGNVTHASRIADRNRTDFYKLLKKHDLQASDYKPTKMEVTSTTSLSKDQKKAS